MERNAIKDIRKGSIKAWILASRPKTLSGAAVPVAIGASAAWMDGRMLATPVILCFVFAMLMQIAANFINDLYDWKKGSDGEDRLGPDRACAMGWISPSSMQKGIIVTLASAAACGLFLLMFGGIWLIAAGIACIAGAYMYTGGPYPLAYHGLGDAMVIVFFGAIPVTLTAYLANGSFSADAVLPAIACGLATDTLLILNNYRDIEQDRKNGKNTLVVKLGHKGGEFLYLWTGAAAASLYAVQALMLSSLWQLLPLLYIPVHVMNWKKMKDIGKGKELNSVLGKTSAGILAFGILASAANILTATA